MAICEKACEGGRTVEDGDMQCCLHCERKTRWDMQDHPFWGWHACPEKTTLEPGTPRHETDANKHRRWAIQAQPDADAGSQ